MSNPYIPFALAGSQAPLPLFEGCSLVVHLVLNVETWPFDQPMPRTIITPPHGVQDVPDVPNYSWVEYGMRVGLPRILSSIQQRGLPASISMNAAVIDDYPIAAELLGATGWEFLGHGVRQRSLHKVDNVAVEVSESLDRLERGFGRRPTGWLSPGLQETATTLPTLHEAGIQYVCDWCVDDIPLWVSAGSGDIVSVPYSLELNDSVLFAVERTLTAEYEERVRTTVELLLAEAERWGTRVLALPLHPHLLGASHRFPGFLRVLDLLLDDNNVAFSSAGEIASWYRRTGPSVAVVHEDLGASDQSV